MKRLVCIVVCLALLGCNNVKDLKFTGKNTEEIAEKVKKSKDLTGEETGLLMAAMVRYTVGSLPLEGKRVGDLIAEQKKLVAEMEAKEKEAKRLAEEEAKKEAAVTAELAKHLTVAPYKKSFHKADFMSGSYEDRIEIDFVFENKGNKDIKAFKGICKFKDLFGETLRSSNITCDETIKVGAKRKWEGFTRYNQFMGDDSKFRNTELANMKFEWVPKAIIFTDGTKVGTDAKEEHTGN